MSAFLFSVLSLTCGSTVSLLVFGLDAILRNLPRLILGLERVFATLNLAAYRLIRAGIYWVSESTGIPLGQPAHRIAASGLLALVAWVLISLLIGFELAWWHFGLAIAYGGYIGWVWHDFELPDGLWIGEDL